VHQAGNVLVTEWIDGTPLSKIITEGDQATRNRAGVLYHRFHLSSPTRVGMLHADPHPGNFRMLDDGRLGVLDFGAVNRLPEGVPPAVGILLGKALRGEAQAVVDGLRAEGFLKPSIDLDPDKALAYLMPFLEPVTVEEFQFTRAWLRAQGTRVGDPRSPNYYTGLQFNLPPRYLLLHRVWLGSIGVLCQLEASGRWREELIDWLPGAASLRDLPYAG
jgi:predicted unusual protein kinase regulating ubiquinone biosynthesis (AarF/ABC1/UbiB family)